MVQQYMVIEYFKNDDPAPIYRRFRDHGRMVPDGLQFITSWVDAAVTKSFLILETDDHTLLDQWISNWHDIIDFEVIPVITSQQAAERVANRL